MFNDNFKLLRRGMSALLILFFLSAICLERVADYDAEEYKRFRKFEEWST